MALAPKVQVYTYDYHSLTVVFAIIVASVLCAGDGPRAKRVLRIADAARWLCPTGQLSRTVRRPSDASDIGARWPKEV